MSIPSLQIRKNFPEFASVVNYPDSALQFWLDFAYSMLNAQRWGAQLDMAAQLYALHNIVLERRAQLEAAHGAAPGTVTGPTSSKSVDKVSVSYDVGVAAEEGAGHWNLTIYGSRLYRMIQMFGMGPVYVGGSDFEPMFNGAAWAGPPLWPGYYGNT